jgi:uncharacterized repeat protein (TIGR03847 family)
MAVVHSYDRPERFVAGTVGPPGLRVFFLQAREGTRLTTVAVEKQQVGELAARIDELLDELMALEDSAVLIPAMAPHGTEDSLPLESPIEEEFRAGTMTLSWDPLDERIVIEVFGVDDPAGIPPDDEHPLEPVEPQELLVVRIDAAAARAFVVRSRSVVGAGRPDCPFCGQPIDAAGHLCVRANGFRRRDPGL